MTYIYMRVVPESPTVSTYVQPPESLGPIQTLPYTAKIPASSDCETFASSDLYAAAASVAPNPTQPSTTSSAKGSGAPSGSGSASRSAAGSGASASSTQSSGAQKHVARATLGLVGAAIGAALLI